MRVGRLGDLSQGCALKPPGGLVRPADAHTYSRELTGVCKGRNQYCSVLIVSSLGDPNVWPGSVPGLGHFQVPSISLFPWKQSGSVCVPPTFWSQNTHHCEVEPRLCLICGFYPDKPRDSLQVSR